MNIFICLLIGFAVCVLLAWMVRDDLEPFGFFFLLGVCCLVSWMLFGETPEWKKEADARSAAQAAAERKPRVIREADGCKVYTFKEGDRWHYFTRCLGQTTTESSYSVRSGKTTRTETESVVTTNDSNP